MLHHFQSTEGLGSLTILSWTSYNNKQGGSVVSAKGLIYMAEQAGSVALDKSQALKLFHKFIREH